MCPQITFECPSISLWPRHSRLMVQFLPSNTPLYRPVRRPFWLIQLILSVAIRLFLSPRTSLNATTPDQVPTPAPSPINTKCLEKQSINHDAQLTKLNAARLLKDLLPITNPNGLVDSFLDNRLSYPSYATHMGYICNQTKWSTHRRIQIRNPRRRWLRKTSSL